MFTKQDREGNLVMERRGLAPVEFPCVCVWLDTRKERTGEGQKGENRSLPGNVRTDHVTHQEHDLQTDCR